MDRKVDQRGVYKWRATANALDNLNTKPLGPFPSLSRPSSPPGVSPYALNKAEAARLLGESVEAHDDALNGANLCK